MSRIYGNPSGAWSDDAAPGTPDLDEQSRDTRFAVSSAALVAKTFVAFGTTGKVDELATTGNLSTGYGVALNAASAANEPVEVCVSGFVTDVPYTGSDPSAGQALSPSNATAGYLKIADGSGPVVAIAAAAGASNLVDVYVLPSPSSTVRAGVIALPITLANVANGDVLTTWTPGFAGKIIRVSFAVTTAVTTPAKAATLNLEIGTTDLTGGTVALTSANCTPLGAVIANAANPSAGNTFTATDTISVEASSVTAFAEGAGVLLISYI